MLPASAYYTVTAKSPMTGILGDSAAGGQFGAAMKRTGFDQIIMTGRSDTLIYCVITDTGVSFFDGKHLADKTILQTTDTIRKERDDHRLEVAAVGPAGERCVPFACIVSSGNRVNEPSAKRRLMN